MTRPDSKCNKTLANNDSVRRAAREMGPPDGGGQLARPGGSSPVGRIARHSQGANARRRIIRVAGPQWPQHISFKPLLPRRPPATRAKRQPGRPNLEQNRSRPAASRPFIIDPQPG
jgi:hypothetical protein